MPKRFGHNCWTSIMPPRDCQDCFYQPPGVAFSPFLRNASLWHGLPSKMPKRFGISIDFASRERTMPLFGEKKERLPGVFSTVWAKPSCLASLNGYFLRPPLFHRAVFPERSSRTSGGNWTCACFLVRARGEFRDVQKSVRYGHHVRCATSNILT